ncbi:MAG: hypothetical protein ACK4FV_03360 [Candidatus Nitrosocaldus sp.]
MVWVYVVVGLLIIIVLLVLLKGEKGNIRMGYSSKRVTDTLGICLSCGSKFRGSRCPYCGFEHAESEHKL